MCENYGTKCGTIDIKICGKSMGHWYQNFNGVPYKPYWVYSNRLVHHLVVGPQKRITTTEARQQLSLCAVQGAIFQSSHESSKIGNNESIGLTLVNTSLLTSKPAISVKADGVLLYPLIKMIFYNESSISRHCVTISSVCLRQNSSKCVNVGSNFSAVSASLPRPTKLFSLKKKQSYEI